ncbi:hypothetical protein DFJ73DRAFT_890779 [Zopfochytrium polystomum]|nr:hypothetical protein DFJ73DRAFT_890779 [Zopfochytrium polystomum]
MKASRLADSDGSYGHKRSDAEANPRSPDRSRSSCFYRELICMERQALVLDLAAAAATEAVAADAAAGASGGARTKDDFLSIILDALNSVDSNESLNSNPDRSGATAVREEVGPTAAFQHVADAANGVVPVGSPCLFPVGLPAPSVSVASTILPRGSGGDPDLVATTSSKGLVQLAFLPAAGLAASGGDADAGALIRGTNGLGSWSVEIILRVRNAQTSPCKLDVVTLGL